MNKWFCIVLFATACTGDNDDFEHTAASAEGIYTVSAYTRNEDSCSPGGTSLLGDDRFAVAVTTEYLGQRVLTVTSCANAADCRAKAADIRAHEPYALEFQFAVSSASDEGLFGRSISTGFGNGGTCTGAELGQTTLEVIGTSLRIVQEITIANDYPADNGFCTTELARENTAGKPCTEMEVLTAELLEVL